MKQAKRLTRAQKEVLSANGLNWKEWLLVTETDFYLKIIHKEAGKRRTLDKFWKGGKRNAGRRNSEQRDDQEIAPDRSIV